MAVASRRNDDWTWIFVVLVVLAIGGAAVMFIPGLKDQLMQMAHLGPKAPSTPVWTYGERPDDNDVKARPAAWLNSLNAVANADKAAPLPATLVVRPKDKTFVVEVSNLNLQFVCSGYYSTNMMIRFDNGPAEKFVCSESDSGAAGDAVINDQAKFISELKKSTDVSIELFAFKRGMQTFHFQPANLNLDRIPQD